MKKTALTIAFAVLAASAHAAGCLVFDATAPLALADGSVVYPISPVFPQVVPVASCSDVGLLNPPMNFVAVDVSATCHTIKIVPNLSGVPAKIAAIIKTWPAKYTTAGLYTDGHGNCGPVTQTKQAAKGSWTSY